MTVYDNDEAPRNLRELWIHFKALRSSIDEMKQQQKTNSNLLRASILSPIVVGIVVGVVLAILQK